MLYGRLGVDVSAADDFRALERLIFARPLPERHNSRHF